MVFYRVDLTVKKRITQRRVATCIHFMTGLLAMSAGCIELAAFLLYLSSGVLSAMWEDLPFVSHKGVVVFGLCISVLLANGMSACVVRAQNGPTSRLTAKKLGEFMMFQVSNLVLVLFAIVLTSTYALRFETSFAKGFLMKMSTYDSSSESRTVVNKIQTSLMCCGVNEYDDYRDFSAVELIGESLPELKSNTLQRCQNKICHLPLSCCRTYECSGYPSLLTDQQNYMDIWYKHKGCLFAVSESHRGIFDPSTSLGLLMLLFIFQTLSLMSDFRLFMRRFREPSGHLRSLHLDRPSHASFHLPNSQSNVCSGSQVIHLCLSSYTSLAQSGLDEKADSVGWLLPFGYPSVQDVVNEMKKNADSDIETDTSLHTEQETSKDKQTTTSGTETRIALNSEEKKNVPAMGNSVHI